MQKDVIYIDVEDDITAIIGKVKDAKEKVVALVPPKRVGVLQSAVNLRLLKRAAEQSHKHLVLITNNQALIGISSSAKIPVAKNLQSKPEIPEIAALSVDDDDDIIDGEQLPVGDHVAMTEAKPAVPDSAISDLDIDGDAAVPKRATPPVAGEKPTKPRVKSGIKVPSFNKFRKKIFIFGGLGVFLIGFLVWAIWFAPHATIIIDAQTTDKDLSSTVTLGADLTSDAKEGTLKAVSQQDKQTASVDFDATGTKEVGERATGTMTITRDGVSSDAAVIPTGTGFSSGNYTFTTTSSATVPASRISGTSLDRGSVTVGVQATAVGEEYNVAAGSYQSTVNGYSATGSQMTGGSKKQIKIVLQADVLKAKQQLAEKNADDIKKALTAKFGNNVAVIDSSFTVTGGDATPAPAIGEEAASGKAKLTQETTYTMTGIDKSEFDTYLKLALENTMTSKDEQRVYSTGLSKVKFSDFKQGERTSTAVVETVGQIGPKIDDNKIKEDAKGKRYGEIQADLKAIDGINDADIKFSPFWVSSVPNDNNKIKIEFKLKNGAEN